MFAQGFAIKKELINGKPVMEEGIMGELSKKGARIIEVNDGRAKYTELSPQDIKKLISMRSNSDNLIERLTPLLVSHKHHRRRHHTRRQHNRRGVARGHTKKHKKRHHTYKHKHKRKYKRTKRRRRRKRK